MTLLTRPADVDPAPSAADRARRRDVVVGVAAIIAAFAVGGWGWWLRRHGSTLVLDRDVLLSGPLQVRVGAITVAIVAAAAALVCWSPLAAARLPWRALLWSSAAVAAAWSVLLALTDGVHKGLIQPLTARGQYLRDVPRVHGVGATLRGFVSHIVGSSQPWSTHVAGHPPGALLTFWALHAGGLGGPGFAAALCIAGGASAVPAVLIVTRDLLGEDRARTAAPFLITLPAAIWIAVSFDAFFLGVTAWAVAAVGAAARSTGARSAALAVVAGLLFAYAANLSYGLVLIAPLAIVVARRRSRALIVAGAAAAAAMLVVGATGFWWFDGLAATRVRVAGGVAGARPYSYFVVADLAVLVLALGPAVAAGVARAARRGTAPALRLLVAAALAGILIADLTGLARGEVERIWLPFMPWIALAVITLPRRDTRWWLGAQLALAIVIQTVVYSPW
ncbi:MAG: hypothetical protein DLM56_07250 [Pseudonocardiales bacterium]|nr:MAG: hypothetical protein DLM56_07250 [Pseudonocardiales bacterium]